MWLTGESDLKVSKYRLNTEIDHFKINNINLSDVKMYYTKTYEEYDELLSKNIVFVDLFDAAANNTVIECIIRNTPIIVNKIEGVIDYLGEDYPLYFTTLDEIPQLLTYKNIEKAYHYLLNMNKEDLNIDQFLKEVYTLVQHNFKRNKEIIPITYICNVTGNTFKLDDNEMGRESGVRFGYNIRYRAISYILTKLLFGEVKILNDIPENKNIKGIGMSDCWPGICTTKFNYINTNKSTLNIYNDTHINNFKDLDFIISSEIFNHIDPFPGVQIAFNNIYKMLKLGGCFILTIPYSMIQHIEHYPNLYNYTIDNVNDKYILHNTTINDQKEVFNNLTFYQSSGKALEMRVFSKKSITTFLTTAGFIDITFHTITEDMNNYGIYWSNNNSLIISAKK